MARFVMPGYVSTRATRIFVGDGLPAATLGNVNDWYKNNDDGKLYQKEDDDVTWTEIGSVAGGAGAGEGFVVLRGASDPVNGAAGTGVGVADNGSRYINETTNAEFWQSGEIDNVQWLQVLAP